MKIKNVKVIKNTPEGSFNGGISYRAHKKSQKPKIYFFIEDETILENLENRCSRPYKEYKKLIPEALTRLNLVNPGYKWKWDPKAGCSMCPCSPGFVPSNMSSIPSNDLTSHSIYVTIGL
jgi:hypothetical protein